MNDDVEVTQEDRLQDLNEAYVQIRGSVGKGMDAQAASALAQLSIAISLIEHETYVESDEESDDDEEEEDEEEE